MRHVHRNGSAIVLILAILTLLLILALGLTTFVSEQRDWALQRHAESLMRQGILSGRAHAMAILDQDYVEHRAANTPTHEGPGQRWRSEFAPTTPWPGPGPTTLNQNRKASSDPEGWAKDNTFDLWSFEPGLASPIVAAGQAHGFDDGFCSHDGAGRWFTMAYLDRSFRPTTSAKAAYQLRYAVGVIDLSGLVLGNKARYEHLTADGMPLSAIYQDRELGLPMAVDMGAPSGPTTAAGACTAATVVGRTQPTVKERSGTPSAQPCLTSDPGLGVTDDGRGSDRIFFNRWRPIPADHSFTAHFLMTQGFGLDDSKPRMFSDQIEEVNGPGNGKAYYAPDDKVYVYYKRVLGDLPDLWRYQGFRQVFLSYWQTSRRFGDFLPFAQNPFPPATNPRPNNGTPESDELNRHPAALLVAVQQSAINVHPASLGQCDPAQLPLSDNRRRLADILNQVDYPNWWALQQGLRLHRVFNDGSAFGLAPAPSKADGITQCWTPFGSPIGFFDDPTLAIAEPEVRKNAWEMAYQWTVNVNTAPPRVLDALIRLTVPDTGDGSGTAFASNESATAAKEEYDAMVSSLVTQLRAKRPMANSIDLAAKVTALATPCTGDDLKTLVYGSAAPGRDSSGAILPPATGPRARFQVVEASGLTDTDSPNIVIRGRHRLRFWSDLPLPSSYAMWNAATTYGAGEKVRLSGNDTYVSTRDNNKNKDPSTNADWWLRESPTPDAVYRFRCADVDGIPLTPVATAKPQSMQFRVVGAEYVVRSGGAYVPETATEKAGRAGQYTRILLNKDDYALNPVPVADVKTLIIDYPGITLATGISRWFRIVIRSELRDLDVPSNTKQTGFEFVYHVDPDRQGPAGNGLWDSDVPYADFINSLRYRSDSGNGAAMW